MSQQQKTALITGCSSGIGYALAAEFAENGFRVIATARNEKSLADLTALHPNVVALPLEVAQIESILALKEKVDEITGGRLDFLINNAGVHYASTALDIDAAKVRNVFEINVVSVMLMCQTFGPALIAAKGVIVQIGSVTRAVPVVWQSPYNATKAALSQYTSTLRLEVEPFGVKVVEVVTGYVQSSILRNGLQAPEDSRYLPIKNHIEELKNAGNQNGMPAATYAKRVFKQVAKTNPPAEIWEGGSAWPLWLVTTWMPRWLRNIIWWSNFKLGLLRSSHKDKSK